MLNDQKTIVNAAPQGGIAQIANVAQCYQAITRTEKRHALAAGIAAFYGPSGLGKSIAALYVANKTGAYYVQAKSVYTRKAFLQAILREMAIVAAPTLSEMLDQVAGELAKSGKPLIIDEFDFLVTGGKVELVRDIYEGSQGVILCIGEERLPTKLEKWERFHSRVSTWQPALPASIEDAALLVSVYAPQIKVADDVLELLVASVKGSTRRVSSNLEMLHEYALSEGWDYVDTGRMRMLLPDGFVTGESPKPRTF